MSETDRKSEKEPKHREAIQSLHVFLAKPSRFAMEFIIMQLPNYFRALPVSSLPNFDRFCLKSVRTTVHQDVERKMNVC